MSKNRKCASSSVGFTSSSASFYSPSSRAAFFPSSSTLTSFNNCAAHLSGLQQNPSRNDVPNNELWLTERMSVLRAALESETHTTRHLTLERVTVVYA